MAKSTRNDKMVGRGRKEVQRMERKRGRKTKRPVKEQFEMMYYNPNMTTYEIADFYGVKIQTVYNWANEFKKEKKDV